VEVYEVIGDYGWFYGDFFIAGPSVNPEYSGIYRFLNNPEKIMGHAGQYGLALMSGSWIIFAIVLFSQCMTFLFLYYVEGVHMKKMYGDKVRENSGLTSALSDKIKPLKAVSIITKNVTDSAENMLNDLKKEVREPIEQLVDKGLPLFCCSYSSVLSLTFCFSLSQAKDHQFCWKPLPADVKDGTSCDPQGQGSVPVQGQVP